MDLHFSYLSRTSLIHSLTQSHETDGAEVRVIAHAVCGSALWSVTEVTALDDGAVVGLGVGESLRYIRCDLLAEGRDGWAHISMTEAEHPYLYSCPLALLELAPTQSTPWRQRVLAYHAKLMLPVLGLSH